MTAAMDEVHPRSRGRTRGEERIAAEDVARDAWLAERCREHQRRERERVADVSAPYGRGREREGRAKLSKREIRRVIALRAQGVSQDALAERFGVGRSTIQRALGEGRDGAIR